jgi:hypothetical protein
MLPAKRRWHVLDYVVLVCVGLVLVDALTLALIWFELP